jgi:hypothetical protein
MSRKPFNDTCGCCAGIDSETPVRLHNPPSQTAISYRVGTHSRFKESMLAALSRADYPALLALGTRDDDDFSIACLDGAATVLDVLTFYQERHANEHYLMTAIERRSVLEMARLIGYELSPGVAAATHLAFTLQAAQAAAGSPPADTDPIAIPARTRVQSVPGQDEEPQVFETTEEIEARAEWNAVGAQTAIPYRPTHGDLDIYVDGVENNLQEGDAVLIVGEHRMKYPGSERWDIRVLKRVEIDRARLRTRLVWDVPLGHTGPTVHPSESDVRLFVFRKRASLFGHNAPDPRLMNIEEGTPLDLLTTGEGIDLRWDEYSIQDQQIDLAGSHDKIVSDGWIALLSNEADEGTPDLPGYLELYRAKKVFKTSRTDYGISGAITRIEPDTTENMPEFKLQQTIALIASEELIVHQRPVRHPVYGDAISLAALVDGLVPGRYLALSGRLQRLKVAPGVSLTATDGTALDEGDSLRIAAIPEKLVGGTPVRLSPAAFGSLIDDRNASTPLRMQLIDRDGRLLTIDGPGANWLWDSREDDPVISEIARIENDEGAVADGRDRTAISLTRDLGNVYQRDTVRINFNVAPANNGETVTEILGDGDARAADQTFVLKQSPLTYVSADTPGGGEAAMEVRVNEVLWSEKPSLFEAAADARVYELRNRDDGTTAVVFGDGVEGGRLPTGKTNVRATYRKYTGTGGNLGKDRLTTLLQKPLGVTEVTNPEPATGGADPEVIADARQNAPLTVLTLDRAVSVQDYRNYARAFAGVAKAHALWIASGPSRGIYITLAGVDGASIPEGSETYTNLMNSLRRYGDPMLPLSLVSFTAATFTLGMAVKIADAARRESVLQNLEATLRSYFSFANRDFGQHVTQDEVLAVAHSVNHVEAVRITKLYRDGTGTSVTVEPIIAAQLPVASLTVPPEPAELLTLSDAPLEMESFS